MAPPSPRRSSRARATNSQSQHSSTSSGTPGRPDRSTRSLNRPASDKSTPSASLSSEPLEDLDDTLLGRRRRRGVDDDPSKTPQSDVVDVAMGSEDLQDDEDEAVRCICGSEEYPGPPPPDAPDAEFYLSHELTEDVTGFFVQCDICKVWQHGACVGIFNAETSPEEYFCEQCRKDFHKIHVASNGLKYSKFLPHFRQSRATSRATSAVKETPRSPKSSNVKLSRAEAALQAGKRRSTMNSRDAAYDDEQLRRAIEASKEDNTTEGGESTVRRTKRGRSDSESNTAVKRQRTSSRSVSPAPEQPVAPLPEDSEDESTALKRSRSSRSQRERSEKEDKERLRQEAANKRKGRAERRRGEADSDLSEELPLAALKNSSDSKSVEPPSAPEPPVITQPTPGTPPTSHSVTGSSHKRGARSIHKKSRGKNQYSKDRDENEESPARSMSRDIQKQEEPAAVPATKPATNDHKHPSKSKAASSSKMSMLDMKRRVAAIMEFISRTQVDLAAEASPSQSGGSSGQESPQKDAAGQTNGAVPASLEKQADLDMDKEFKDLTCVEMMDVLTRDMVKWQNQYT